MILGLKTSQYSVFKAEHSILGLHLEALGLGLETPSLGLGLILVLNISASQRHQPTVFILQHRPAVINCYH